MTEPRSTLETAEARLREHQVEVPAWAQARVARAVQTQLAPPRITWAHAGLACAAALGITWARLQTPAPPPEPALAASPWLRVQADNQIGSAHVWPGPGTEIQLADVELGSDLRLWRGEARFEVPALKHAPALGVQTRQARIVALGARFSVQADPDQTFVSVTEGEVQIFAGRSQKPQVLRPGRRIRIGRSAPKAAEPAPVAQPATTTPPRRAPPPIADAQADLRDARRWLEKDADRAADMAERVIQTRPEAPVQLQALLLLADARRRAGRRPEAADIYQRILSHPERGAFEEETRFQRAHLLHEMGRDPAAIEELESAHRLHPEGPLAPERCALWAQLLLDRGDARGAAQVLQRVPDQGWSRLLDESRLAVAQGLVHEDPERALVLAQDILRADRAPDLMRAAQQLVRDAIKFEGQPAPRRPMVDPQGRAHP